MQIYCNIILVQFVAENCNDSNYGDCDNCGGEIKT